MVTAEWLKSRIEKREQRIRNEGIAEGIAQALAVLDKDTRKEVERKLRLNEHSEN